MNRIYYRSHSPFSTTRKSVNSHAAPAAEPKIFRDGQTLFAVGDREHEFFVVKSGEVEIVDFSGDQPKTITVHRRGEFTGDVTHLTGCPSSSAPSPAAIAKSTRSPADALRRS